MRLDDFDPNINVEDQRGASGGGGFGGGGMLLGLLPMVFSRFGCGGVAILLIGLAVFGGFGSILGGGSGPAPTSRVGQSGSRANVRRARIPQAVAR